MNSRTRARVFALLASGTPCLAISREVGVPYGAVLEFARSVGVPRKPGRKRGPAAESVSRIATALGMISDGASVADAARATGVSRQRLHYQLKHDLPYLAGRPDRKKKG